MSDLICRQKAIDALPKIDTSPGFAYKLEYMEQARKAINEIPSATGRCSNCGRNADNGGYYEPEHRTRCPIQEHYALLLDGFCHLWEPVKE